MTNDVVKLSDEFPDILRASGIKSKGFGIAPKYAMLDTELTIQAKGIYAYFCSFTGRGNCAFPGRDRILKDLLLSKNTYYNHFNLLTEQGYLTVTQERAQQFFKNIYTIESYPVKFCMQENDVSQSKTYGKIRIEGIESLGYGIIPKIVMIDSRLDIKAKAIYAYLCVFSGSGQSAHPRITNLLHHLGISENTYYKHFNSLTALNYIKAERRRISGKLSVNDYFLVSNPDVDNVDNVDNILENDQFVSGFSPFSINQDTRESQCLSGFSPSLKNQDTRNQDTRNWDINSNSINSNNLIINQSIHQQGAAELPHPTERMNGLNKRNYEDYREKGEKCEKDYHEKDYREIMDGLGKGKRMPATKERQYMDKWLDEYAMPLPVILEACDRAVINTDKRVFAYCDTILTNWHKGGVASLDDVRRVSAEFAHTADGAGRVRKPKPTRFANFKQREWDFEEVERVERAYQKLKREKALKKQ